jgi:ABC-type dipeptide/oligopeptide/nickel transport system permease subunit
MKALATLIGIIAPATAFAAATGATDEGNGIFVWIFLGFFAVIIVGQIVPAIMLMTGLVKGIIAKKVVNAEEK